MHRAQILLHEHQHKALSQLAEREGRSISALVREMVDQELERRNQAKEELLRQRLENLELIAKHRQEILASRGGKPLDVDIAALINQNREERDAEILAAIGLDRPRRQRRPSVGRTGRGV